MTNPVILLGTQSNGETRPVQVNATGRLVAEGLQGSEGPEGPPGPEGPEGPQGPSFELPPDPYEGALLGWLNNELAWVGTPPVPIPPDVFGPITAWDPLNGLLTVEGEIPATIGNGVYVNQVNAQGELYTADHNVTQEWSDGNWNNQWYALPPNIFDGDIESAAGPNTGQTAQYNFPVSFLGSNVQFFVSYGSYTDVEYALEINGQILRGATSSSAGQWLQMYSGDPAAITSLSITCGNAGGGTLHQVKVDGKILLERSLSTDMRVNQIFSDNQLIGVCNNSIGFEPGQYLKVFGQRVAPWVLYGNDPTSLIDHLRSS